MYIYIIGCDTDKSDIIITREQTYICILPGKL